LFSKEAVKPPRNIPKKVKDDTSLNPVDSRLNVAWNVEEEERLLMRSTSMASEAVHTPNAKIIQFISLLWL